MNNKYHFYYSEMQAELILDKFPDFDGYVRVELNSCSVNGVVMKYTECHNTPLDHSERFPDSKYLGYGEINRIGKIIRKE